MSTDARLSTGLQAHPKTKKLIRRAGEGGAWAFVCLILWTRANRPDGDLAGMTGEDIELAVDWRGEADALVAALLAVGFLDGTDGAYVLHDWTEHQPWASGSEQRSDRAKWAALIRREGRDSAAAKMPEYAAKLASSSKTAASSTENSANSSDLDQLDSANSKKSPAPSPSPSPSPKKEEHSSQQLTLQGDVDEGDSRKSSRANRVRQIAEEAQEAYNRILAKPAGLLVRCTVLNEPRIKALRKSIVTAAMMCQTLYGDQRVIPKFWDDYFSEVARDDFHSGRGPYRPPHEHWRPDFEFLLREDVMAKLFDRAQSADDDEASE